MHRALPKVVREESGDTLAFGPCAKELGLGCGVGIQHRLNQCEQRRSWSTFALGSPLEGESV